MKHIFLVLLSLVVANVCAAQKLQNRWELIFKYNEKTNFSIVSCLPIQNDKKVRNPSLTVAIEKIPVRLEWYSKSGELISTTETVLPIGNKYDESCKVHGACASQAKGSGLLRVSGPEFNKEVSYVLLKSAQGIALTRYDLKTAFSRSLPAPGPSTIHTLSSTGTDTKRNVMVFLGDGYTQDEINSGKYTNDVNTVVSFFQSQEPWPLLLKVSNIYSIDVVSNESGADIPSEGVSKDTYFNTTYDTNGINRLLTASGDGESLAMSTASDYLGSGIWDVVIIVVNSSKYGGGGGPIAVFSTNEYAPEVGVHELGHTLADLADEYSDPYPGFPETITEPNVDSDGVNPKWSLWLTGGAPLPTTDSDEFDNVVGAFEGARYKETGVFRPMRNCKMRALLQPFCPVCQEALVSTVLKDISFVDSVTPKQSKSVQLKGNRSKKFKISTVSMLDGFTYSWSLCGRKIKNAGENSVNIKKSQMRRSSCKLTGKVSYTDSHVRKVSSFSDSVNWTVRR